MFLGVPTAVRLREMIATRADAMPLNRLLPPNTPAIERSKSCLPVLNTASRPLPTFERHISAALSGPNPDRSTPRPRCLARLFVSSYYELRLASGPMYLLVLLSAFRLIARHVAIFPGDHCVASACSVQYDWTLPGENKPAVVVHT
jgi:hypothetical protein